MSTVTKYTYRKPEIWGGIECTINRVANQYRDQLAMSGHYERPGDLELFATLGVSKMRYPVLWEKHQPSPDTAINWQWISGQLETLRSLRIEPIAGLVHHGSGPRFTDLADEKFAEKLANYARKVAEQFPWLNFYTPVNEPLTTARFSGLYGFWYPHQENELLFFTMLLNQLKGVVLAMREIRSVNPGAMLVQTEDLSKTHSTRLLSYQARFENERRWLTNDILCGKLDTKHFFWKYLRQLGIPREKLAFFLENPCPPSIIGFNYYVTSERWLDHNIENYPAVVLGGNKRHRYADVEAVRAGKQSGLSSLLREAWQRYKLPMAVTECHLNCTREEQLRWLKETWDHCNALCHSGIDIRAMTAWSLLGAYDWNSLLTVANQHYEAGVFDISDHKPRITSLGKLLRSLAATGEFEHPLLNENGWWHAKKTVKPRLKTATGEKQPLLIIGNTGTLGQAFGKVCAERSIPFVALGRQDLDILREESISGAIERYQPWALINATGYVRVDDAENDAGNCFAVNTTAPSLMAKVCRQKGIRLMTFSSDLVFDGNKRSPYHEEDETLPLNIYGRSKAEGEKKIMTEDPSALIIRTSAFFGPWDRYNFVFNVLKAIETKSEICLPDDVMVSPTYVPDLCHMAMDLFIDEERGVWHLSNDGMITWAGFGEIIAARSGCKNHRLVSKPLIEMGWKAKRPLYSVLGSDKGIKLPSLDHAINRYFEQRTL